MIMKKHFCTFYHSDYIPHLKTSTTQDIFPTRKVRVNQPCPLHDYGHFVSATTQTPHLVHIWTASQPANQMQLN